MVYKKYIKRGGKVYGPYIYHSKRVDGKVISEYRGNKIKNKINKKYLWSILGLIFIFGLFLTLPSKGNISGHATLGLESNYTKGEFLDGVLKFSLKEGELIPADTKIIFENSGKKYEYLISEITNNETIEGEYYLEEKSVSGYGKGYGIPGVIENAEEISFTLNIITSNESTDSEIEEPQNDSIEKNNSVEETNQINDSIIIETNSSEINETNAEIEEANNSETNLEENISNESTSKTNETKFENTTENQNAPITGGAITSLFKWRGTGNVILDSTKEISGKVSKDNPFTYKISENQEAQIKSGSVSLTSKLNEGNLPESTLNLEYENDSVKITTEYTYNEIGFGKKYLGNKNKILEINISKLNLSLEEGDLNISLTYQNEKIFSLRTILEENFETKDKEKTNVTNPEILDEIKEVVLTETEKEILREKFENASVKNIRSEVIGNKLFIGYRLGDERVEFVYDSSEKNSQIKKSIEADKNSWLKEISQKIISKNDSKPTKVGIVNEESEI